MRAVLLLALALLAALPGTAAAKATVSFSDAQTVLIEDDSQATNDLFVDAGAGIIWVFGDNGNLDAVAPCTLEATHVECDAAGVTSVRVELGPGDDRLRPSTQGTLRRVVMGEGGDDELAGAPGNDVIDGGDDDDLIDGGAGDDELLPGGGANVLSYYDHPAGVDVTLPGAGVTLGNGAGTESDQLHPGFTTLSGSAHADDLTGSPGGETILGHDGDDHIRGSGGPDDLFGNDGADTIEGGEGDDWIDAAENTRPADDDDPLLDCGGGTDEIDADNPIDATPTGCETIAPEVDGGSFTGLPARVGRTIGIDLRISGGPATPIVTWMLCRHNVCGRRAENAFAYTLASADLMHSLQAEVRVENSAGYDQREIFSGELVKAALPPAPPAPADDTPPPEPPQPPPPIVEHVLPPFEALSTALGGAVADLARRHRGTDPRSLARRGRAVHRLMFPSTGVVTLRWIVGGRTIGSGRADGAAGQRSKVVVRFTRRGRRMLRRSKRLRATLSASFVGGPATKARPAVASAPLTLRRTG